MAANVGDTVKVRYTGRLLNGEVFDHSSTTEPLQFTIGEEEVFPGFADAVVGMSPGESKTCQVECHKAFGPREEKMVVTVARDKLPADLEPEVGQLLRTTSGEMVLRIVGLSDDNVTLDANHPLAGQDLLLDITLEEIVGQTA